MANVRENTSTDYHDYYYYCLRTDVIKIIDIIESNTTLNAETLRPFFNGSKPSMDINFDEISKVFIFGIIFVLWSASNEYENWNEQEIRF